MQQPVIYIIDDDPDQRAALVELFKSVRLTCHEFSDAVSFMAHKVTDGPGCIVMDVRLPGLNGLEVQRQLAATGIVLPIIFLTGFPDIQTAVNAMRNGAFDFMEKPPNPTDLLSRVNEAIDKSRHLIDAANRNRVIRERLSTLTEREQQVLRHVVEGMANKDIAGTLGVSCKTVEFHRSRLMRKMSAGSLPQLVADYITVSRTAWN